MAFEYVKKDTPLDRMNPLVKLLYMAVSLLLVIQCTQIEHISILVIWILIAVLWWIVGKVELSSLGFLLKLLSFLFVFLFILQGLTYRFGDSTVVLKFFDFPIYDQAGNVSTNYGEMTVGGIMYGLLVALRVISVVIVIPIFTMTSPMSKISAALSKIRIPEKIVFMFITAMRFVPLVQESMDSIIEAQKIRGFDIDKANIFQKMRKAYIPIITPLLLLMFRKAMDLEVAINARAFGARKNPTYVEDVSFKARDYIATFIILSLFGLEMYLMHFEPTHITWIYLIQILGAISSIIGSFMVSIGFDVFLRQFNEFLLLIPGFNIVGQIFNQNLLLGYGAIFTFVLVFFIIYKVGRRMFGDKKRAKR